MSAEHGPSSHSPHTAPKHRETSRDNAGRDPGQPSEILIPHHSSTAWPHRVRQPEKCKSLGLEE